MRVFADDAGKMNLALGRGRRRVAGHLAIHAARRHQRRTAPVVHRGGAARAGARRSTSISCRSSRARGVKVETGEFGAHMEVALVNDGPVTIILDSRDAQRNGFDGTEQVSTPSSRAKSRFAATATGTATTSGSTIRASRCCSAAASGKTPTAATILQVAEERASITVEDTPYVVKAIDGDAQSGFTVVLNDDDREAARPGHARGRRRPRALLPGQGRRDRARAFCATPTII